ncbi:hypothetical protein QBC34DRAFT_437828 [Podospora aff. communis PSN243]|uniref:Uncharacterized protein n=1 Tax=Podospora aff. communis PSN243 TaxID=3040156 RepID=A0AAV9GQL5_9PEZI|nr:hypothetical protein QBC34DRAFT_437828 [Podospora aff. communis PSN243]
MMGRRCLGSVILSLLLGTTAAKVLLEKPTDQCYSHATQGTETCCCNGDCGSGPVPQGEWMWGMGCKEYETPSVCSNSQVYRTDNASVVDVGGRCYSICNWERWQYSYQCCDCPPGFISTAGVSPNCGSIGETCVGCSEPWETPVKTGTSIVSWECRRRGMNCDAVDAISRGFDAASRGGGSTASYYGQLLDQACLRSNCSSIASCQRVASFQSKNNECRNLDGNFEFEQTVLEETAKATDDASVATAAKETDDASTALSNAFGGSSIALGSENPLLSLFIIASGGTDPAIWGKTYAGISHFSVALAPQIQGFIRDIVKSTNNTQELESKLIQVADQQERMFRCAVIPNLQSQAANNQLLPNPSLAGSLLAPLSGATLRMAATQVELDRAKRFDSLRKSLTPLGITLPRSDTLIWNPRNWDDAPTLPGLSTTLTELSPSTDLNPTIKLSLAAESKYTLSVQILDRDTASTPLMARTSLLDPNSNPSLPSPMSWKIKDQSLNLVAPIAAIYPALGDLAMWNATHVLPANISAEPILFEDYLAKGQEQATTGFDKSATTGVDKYVMYRKAKIKMGVAKDLLDKYPAKDLAVYDLVSGMKMEAEFREMPDGGGGEFSADVSAGRGSYDGQWGGGGCFGLGYTGERSVAGRRGVAVDWVVGVVVAACVFWF